MLSWHGMNALLWRRSEGAIIPLKFLHAGRSSGPGPPCPSQRGPLLPPRMHTQPRSHSITHTHTERGLDWWCKRPHWYSVQTCLWHQCCRCYCPPRERTMTEAHPARVYTLPREWAFSPAVNATQSSPSVTLCDPSIDVLGVYCFRVYTSHRQMSKLFTFCLQ